MQADHTTTIRDQNDLFRQNTLMAIDTGLKGQIVITRGIQLLDTTDQLSIAIKVRDFDTFTEENDPYGEHDFGAITHEGQKFFWKIDYYDPDCHKGSIDPSNPDETFRVLTIMLAEEY